MAENIEERSNYRKLERLRILAGSTNRASKKKRMRILAGSTHWAYSKKVSMKPNEKNYNCNPKRRSHDLSDDFYLS